MTYKELHNKPKKKNLFTQIYFAFFCQYFMSFYNKHVNNITYYCP